MDWHVFALSDIVGGDQSQRLQSALFDLHHRREKGEASVLSLPTVFILCFSFSHAWLSVVL